MTVGVVAAPVEDAKCAREFCGHGAKAHIVSVGGDAICWFCDDPGHRFKPVGVVAEPTEEAGPVCETCGGIEDDEQHADPMSLGYRADNRNFHGFKAAAVVAQEAE